MLVTKTVKKKWAKKNKKYYESKGYIFTNYGDEFDIKIDDLSPGTDILIELRCDYCEKPIFKRYVDYLKWNKKTLIKNDCCLECSPKKSQEVCKIMHGVSHYMKTEEIKQKTQKTNLKKYGVKCPTQNIDVKKKIKETNLNKYGSITPVQNKEIKEKVRLDNLKKYGVEYYSQTQEWLEKVHQTNLKNFGCENVFQSEVIKEKIRETNLKKYGVLSYTQTKEYKEKSRITSLKKYGVDHPFKSEEVKNKCKKTNIEKYGFPSVAQNYEIKMKIKQSLYKNGTAPSSQQQRHIHSIIGGELNYPVGTGILLDIAFPEEKIYLEYDGGGHDLSVRLGSETIDEFNIRNSKRWWFLYRRDWKEIRIISKCDKLPTNDIILKIIGDAKNLLNNNFHRVVFDLDGGTIETSEFIEEYDFGKLSTLRRSVVI